MLRDAKRFLLWKAGCTSYTDLYYPAMYTPGPNDQDAGRAEDPPPARYNDLWPERPRVRSTLLTEFHGAGPNAPGYLVRLPGEAFIPMCARPRDAAGHLDLGCGGEQRRQIGHREIAGGVHSRARPCVAQNSRTRGGYRVALVEAVVGRRYACDVVDEHAVLALDAADLGRRLGDGGAQAAAKGRTSGNSAQIGADEDRLQLGT